MMGITIEESGFILRVGTFVDENPFEQMLACNVDYEAKLWTCPVRKITSTQEEPIKLIYC